MQIAYYLVVVNNSDHIRVVELNVTELCTRKCWFCPRADPNVYPNQNKHMSMETFQHIYDALCRIDYKHNVHFSGFCEPLLGKNTLEGMKLLSSRFNVKVITNGDVITPDILKLLDSYKLKELKIDLYDGEHQYEKFTKMIYSCGYQSKNVLLNKVYEQEKLMFYNRSGTSNFKSEAGLDVNRPCYVPFYKIIIDWTGDYILCMSDWHRRSDITKARLNISEYGLDEYLNSEPFKVFANKMIETKRNGLTPCSTCDIDGTKLGYYWNPNETKE